MTIQYKNSLGTKIINQEDSILTLFLSYKDACLGPVPGETTPNKKYFDKVAIEMAGRFNGSDKNELRVVFNSAEEAVLQVENTPNKVTQFFTLLRQHAGITKTIALLVAAGIGVLWFKNSSVQNGHQAPLA